MAIAPLPQQEELELFEVPWPKPALRLVDASWVEDNAVPAAPLVSDPRRDTWSQPSIERTVRRAPEHRSVLGRLLVGLAIAGVIVLLCLPLRLFGTVTVSGVPTPGGSPAGLGDGSAYVVHPGDTVASIAHEIDPGGDQAALIHEIEHTTGSSVVVPGEHIILP